MKGIFINEEIYISVRDKHREEPYLSWGGGNIRGC